MKPVETREDWLARKVAEARESVKAGRVYTPEQAEAKMAGHMAAYEARARGKAA
jgi:hypothetical protein